MAFKPDIYVVEHIGSGFLAVKARPVPGEWIEDEFKNIAAFGIGRVVSLLEPDEAKELGLAREAQLCLSNRMEFVSYPIADRGLPACAKEFGRFCYELYGSIAGGQNTVVHCRAGIGRSGIISAGILLHAGFEPSEAFSRISEARRIAVPDTDEQRSWVSDNHLTIVGNNARD